MKQTRLLMFGHAGNQDPTLLDTIDVGPYYHTESKIQCYWIRLCCNQGRQAGAHVPLQIIKIRYSIPFVPRQSNVDRARVLM